MKGRRGEEGRKRGSRCDEPRRREARRNASRRCSTVRLNSERRAAHRAEPLTPPARGRTCACRASPCCATPTWRRTPGSRPARRERTRRRVRRASRDVRFVSADAGVGMYRAIAREGGRPRGRESATRRRGEEDAFNGGIRRGRTRGAAGASAFARGKALKNTAPGWTLSGKSGVGGETRGALASSVVGEGRTFSPTRAPAMTTATYTLERCLRRERWGRDGTKSADEVGRWSKRCVGEGHRGARPQMSRAAHRPKACTHRHGRPVESLEHDDRAVGLRCQRTPAVGGGKQRTPGGNPNPGEVLQDFSRNRVQQ